MPWWKVKKFQIRLAVGAAVIAGVGGGLLRISRIADVCER